MFSGVGGEVMICTSLYFDCLAVKLAASAASDGQTRFRRKHLVPVPRATEFKVSKGLSMRRSLQQEHSLMCSICSEFIELI